MEEHIIIGALDIQVKGDTCSIELLLETDERARLTFSEEDMNRITTAWLGRDTPALAMAMNLPR